MTAARELVVLLDEDGNAIGTEAKQTVHHRATPLHLAFSCYVFDPEGSLLISQRALHKPTWPGVWTNSFCGHPAPEEDLLDAVRRRGEQELGARLRDLSLVLPAFRYQAEMPDGTRENEMCPVFVAVADGPVQPDPDEVEAVDWVPWVTFRDDVAAGRRAVSPWCVQQVRALAERETGPGRFEHADPSALPPAARPAG